MTPASPVVPRSGYWCTVTTRAAVDGEVVSTARVKADSAVVAMCLVRVNLRTLMPALSPHEETRAIHWLETSQWKTLRRLHHGGTVTVSFQYRNAEVEWCVRPALPLPRPAVRTCRKA